MGEQNRPAATPWRKRIPWQEQAAFDPSRTPKTRFVIHCLLFVIEFRRFSHKQNQFFIWILARSDPELVQNMFKSYFLSWGHPAGAFFPNKTTILDLWEMFNLNKLHFCLYLVNFPTYWCPSAAKCKRCMIFAITRRVFDGRCHQVL